MKTHTVQPGESLSLISKTYFGDFSMVNEIAKLNNISNVNLIQPGQLIKIPDVQEAEVIETIAPGEPKSSAGKWIGWAFVLGAAGLLWYEANKQRNKNKSLGEVIVIGSPKAKKRKTRKTAKK